MTGSFGFRDGLMLFLLLNLNSLKAQTKKDMTVTLQNVGIVEITTFKLNAGVSEAAFLKAAETLQSTFLNEQEGFIQRTITQGEEGVWTDIVFWTNKAAVTKAMQAAQTSEEAAPFMQMIDPTTVKMNFGKAKYAVSQF